MLLDANTLWKRVRLTLGLGTRAANLPMKSKGSKIISVVPSRYGILSRYRMFPWGVSDRAFNGQTPCETLRERL